MASYKDSGKGGDSWHGVGDGRPCSSTSPSAQQKPRTTDVSDFCGVGDNRPKSGTGASQTVKK